MSHFDFKQFRICHDRCAMKVGTDGVLLGAWAQTDGSRRILDIGTGSGLIALMMAQRCDAAVTGIEIDADAAAQAAENAAASPFADRVEIVQTDLKDFRTEQPFDNIVSNPPFYTESVLPPDATRAAARHTQGLPLGVLVGQAKRLMAPDARFQVILPTAAVAQFLGICALQGLSLLRRTDVCTREGKPFKRALLCLINNIEATRPLTDSLPLSDGKGGRSADYRQLTEDFYL